MKFNPMWIPYILVAALLIIGLVGVYIDNCLGDDCCQSYVGELSGSKQCAEKTYYGERPWSIEMIFAGIFIGIATVLLRK